MKASRVTVGGVSGMLMDADMSQNEVIDLEWLQLILMARQQGLTLQQVRDFLHPHELDEVSSESTPQTEPAKTTVRETASAQLSENIEC